MSDQTSHHTQESLRSLESRESALHGGKIPKDSDTSALKSTIAQNEPSKADLIASRQANLELPEQPPTASDWNSADASKVNVGSGGVQSDVSTGGGSSEGLRGPATGDSSVRTDGEEWKTNTAPGAGVGREGVGK